MGLLEGAARLRVALVLTMAACFPGSATDTAASPDECEVKAAFLVGFARFMDHPQGEEVYLCIAGDSRMAEVLKRTAAGKSVGTRNVSVRVTDRKDKVAGCSILFIGSQRIGLLREIAREGAEIRVLTVGDGPSFLDSGGAVEFVWSGNKIQFNASLAVIQRSGVKVNSRLLTLARNLRNSGSQ